VESFAPVGGGGGAFAAADGMWFTWAEEFGGRLLRIGLTGTGTPELLLAGLRRPAVLVADAGAVYWTSPETDGVLRLAARTR
jgi:hypothetical protein